MVGKGFHLTGLYNASSNGIGNATSEVTNGVSSIELIWAIWFCLIIDVLPFILWGKRTLTCKCILKRLETVNNSVVLILFIITLNITEMWIQRSTFF